jgi:hypothetical protein
VFVWKALGKVPTEEDNAQHWQSRLPKPRKTANEMSRQSRGFWEDVLNEVKNGNTVT